MLSRMHRRNYELLYVVKLLHILLLKMIFPSIFENEDQHQELRLPEKKNLFEFSRILFYLYNSSIIALILQIYLKQKGNA